MARKLRLRPEADREPRVQCAALPWRRTEAGEVEILLITSRETRRWVIPKGWPHRGLGPAASAAREAFEEAGVLGEVSRKPIGAYRYDKRLKSGRVQHVRVAVYAMRVVEERDAWPEMGEREKQWARGDEAASRVTEPELSRLIGAFNPSGGQAAT